MTLLASILIPFRTYASPPVREGSDCQKVNSIAKVGAQELRCTSFNNGLTWRINTQAKFENSRTSITQLKEESPTQAAKFEPRFSPTVDRVRAKKIIETLDSAAQFWSDAFLTEEPIVIIFATEKDQRWYFNQLENLGIDQQMMKDKREAFLLEKRRNGSRANMAGMNGFHGVYWFEFFIGTAKIPLDQGALKVGPHEYTHFAQYSYIGTENLKFVPCWFMEGAADFYGYLLSATNGRDLVSIRRHQVNEKYPLNFPGMRYEVSQGWERFLEENGPQVSNPRYNSDCGINGTYPVGAAATEFLFNLKGHKGILEFMTEIKNTNDFKSALKSVYGLSWREVKQEMAEYIRLIVAQNS